MPRFEKGSESAKEYMSSLRAKRNKKVTGDGLGDTAKALIKGRSDYQPKVRDLLDKHGEEVVAKATLVRNPVMNVWKQILNVLSFGDFEKQLKKTPYDELYHLRIEVVTNKGTRLTIEKNQTINMEKNMKYEKNVEKKVIQNIPSDLKVIDLMNNTQKKMGKKFFPYSALKNNCQDFIMALLESNNLGDQEDKDFVKQDVKQLYKQNKTLSKLVDGLTGIAERAEVLVKGAGTKCEKCVLCKGTGMYELVD
jgi:hypothetical protein